MYVHCKDEETLVTLLTSIVTLGLHVPNKCRKTSKTSKSIQKYRKASKNIEEHIIQPQHVFACANSTSSTGVDFASGGAAFVEASPSVNTRTATQNHLQLLWDVGNQQPRAFPTVSALGKAELPSCTQSHFQLCTMSAFGATTHLVSS